MRKFEYKTLEFTPTGKWIKRIEINSSEIEIQLNEMGRNGWEFVSSIDYLEGGYTKKVILFFKKEIALPKSYKM